ncbi:phytase [Micromonospora endophytica]|uniref:Hydrolase n=1 Tax=Micromonospora endophytica TaxID=515350 RepID=A0A2W2BY68_9ACTN|nr:phytase [Micromonospora endophytica]PZF84798.1 hydrolase [Micromonospora endophytica]RIW46613.1 phytase [Micromonospora endophytica]
MRQLVISVLVVAPLLLPGTPANAAPDEPHPVRAVLETPSLHDDEVGGDADADDPAIWVHPTDRAGSLVVVTAKNGGLRVYDLRGRERQAIPTPTAPGPGDEAGRFNNVDLVTGFRLGHRRVDLAVVTDRGRDQLRFYRIDPVTRMLVDVTAPDVPYAFSRDQSEVNTQRTAYGLGTYTGPDGAAYAVVSRRSTPEVAAFRLVEKGGRVGYRQVDRLTLPAEFTLPDGTRWSPCADPGDGPQVEGTVIDPATGVVYLAQETVGLWRTRLIDGRFTGRPVSVERVREYGIPAVFDPVEDDCVVDYSGDPGFGGRIAQDVEGLTIYPTGRFAGTLIVSSQGDDTFYTYDRRTARPTGRFAVVDGGVDGAQECDGAAAVATPLPGFPGGLLVVHDGRNTPTTPDEGGVDRPDTNVKFLDAGFLRRLR